MKTANDVCGKCSAKIPADARQGVCPACLLETALGLIQDEPVVPQERDNGDPAGSTEIPSKFGDFEIAHREDDSLWELGHGGMGVTYLAVDNVLRRKVALKVIGVPAAARTSHSVRERFLREARAAAALRHPNVAAVYHFGASADDSHCYYAMELIEGETLEARVRKEGPLNAKLVLEIALQITRALMAAAAHGLIHRDLKPGNVMLTRGDADTSELEVKVIDFGLAKVIADAGGEMDLTQGQFVGTPNFASPEQFERGPVDVRSDIYSLGVTLWFALTGKTPFAGRHIEEIRSAQKSNALPVEQLKAAGVPSSLRSLLGSMLAFEPAARPGIQDLAGQLRRCSALADLEMAADGKKQIQLEIAHVLFIDIVGYSKLSINEEHATVDELTQIVRSTEQFQKAEAADRLIKIPSGDGMALVFYTTPEAPVRCAMQISGALQDHPRLHIRMGIHSGPVSGVVDVTGRTNLAGAGLNLAQRVMKCGDAGHILLSKRVAEDLSEFDEWRPLLHELGSCEVKHGLQVAVINLCSDDVGNRQLPQKFQAVRQRRARVRWAEVVAALLLLAAIATAFVLVSKKSATFVSVGPGKSIAVLPFENLSEDKANAYFAEGMQEEILTRLAKIADLKVISRTSTQRDQSKPRNLAQIAKQLGVANILEGSVQKAADQVRINVQLINAQTDSHLWAETYDRKSTDIFGVESEIAKRIAESLQAKLTGREEQALAATPTNNPEAYDAYLRGLAFDERGAYSSDLTRKAIDSYERAVQLDPNFALAWARLSRAHASLCFVLDNTLARRNAAKRALENAQKLQPNSPETQLAVGYYQYHVPRDYGPAKTTFERVSKLLPGNSEAPHALGLIARREGNWDESVAYFEQALALDPRNTDLLSEAASTFALLRQFPTALKLFDRALDIIPNDPDLTAAKAGIYQAQGNLQEAAKLLREINAQTASGHAFRIKIVQLRLERNHGEAIRLLQARQSQFHFPSEIDIVLNQLMLAWTQRLAGDTTAAKATAEQARNTLEKQPDNSDVAGLLASANAVLGEKNSALNEIQRAIMLLPSAKDRLNGPTYEEVLALIQMTFGENSRAISTLTQLLQTPYISWIYGITPVTPALLRLDPFLDPLRADPAFQKLCEEKQPIAPESMAQSAPAKSIAVLPFENLSRDPDNAYFAEGIQEEILTRLAKIADLKVISRTSTQQYQSKPGNLSEIAKQLGVANILEGSVQKAGDQVRVNVQLVDAQTDSHLWAETYDRKLTDIFGVESDIAKGVAESLQAKLTGREEQELVKPTNNPEAYDAYLRGLALEARSIYSDTLLKAIDFYERAVQLDPNFALAWARLSRADAYLNLRDTTIAHQHAAKAALENAQKLEPNFSETLLAVGYYQYCVLRDYGLAKTTFKQVSRTLPGSSEAPMALGRIARREGHWDESIAYFEQALALDPRNVELLIDTAGAYAALRQFPAALKLYDRALDIVPNDLGWMAAKAFIYQAEGNLQEAAKLLTQADAQSPSPTMFRAKITQLRLEGNLGEAVRLLQARQTQFHFTSEIDKAVDQLYLAGTQRLAGDTASAKTTAERARDTLGQLYKNQPDNEDLAALLAVAYAWLNQKDSALKEAERAITLFPSAKDALVGPGLEERMALVEMITGENSRAVSTLTQLLQTPYAGSIYGVPVTPALLRLDPLWDPLRADPAFQRLCEQKSIAVLPFENLSRDPDNAYFADGIQEEILTRLSKIADLKVIARTSTERYRSAPASLREIGEQLGVANVLEGSVQKAADQVRVNVELINAATQAHLWADTYDRKLTDIFAVESDIATKIADMLQAKLTGAEQREIAARPTENSAAYELYLRGRYFLGKRSETDLKNAVDYFIRAIAEDRNYGPAYAGLATCYALLAEWRLADRAESARKAREAATKALEIDDSLAEAHAALALLLWDADLDVHGTQRELERAIELNPNYATAHHWLAACVLAPFGEHDHAISELKRALELDPFSPIINANFGRVLILARRYPEAIAQLRRTIELEPNFFLPHWVLGMALVLNGQIDEGIAEYERAQQLRHDASALGYLVNAYARKGDRQKGLQILERIKQSSNTRIEASPVAISSIAIAYAGLGDKNEAMNWLERSYAQKEADGLIQIRVDPFLDPLHGDPRFEALAQKVLPNQ